MPEETIQSDNRKQERSAREGRSAEAQEPTGARPIEEAGERAALIPQTDPPHLETPLNGDENSEKADPPDGESASPESVRAETAPADSLGSGVSPASLPADPDKFEGLDDADFSRTRGCEETPKSEQPGAGMEAVPFSKDPAEPSTVDSAESAEHRPAGRQRPGRRVVTLKKTMLLLIAVVIGSAPFHGLLISALRTHWESREELPADEIATADAPETATADALPQAALDDIEPEPAVLDPRGAIEAARSLRDELLFKRDEINQLRLYYQTTMEDLEQALAEEMQDEKDGFDSFATAISRKPIELKLKSIQRRQAYIDQLGKPLEWIDRGSEELLFLMRRATLDEHMQDVAGGIDMEKHVRVINAALKQYLPTPDKLAIRPDDAALTPLKEIWHRVSKRDRRENVSQPESVRRAIELAICNGDASRVSELKQLTVEGAKCLSKMPGSALLLNGLEGMSPVAATYLLQWNGDWICMNGIETLNPPLARALFEWEGEWISLNGVTKFPARVARFLLGWKGRQLELTGLRQLPGQTALQYLADWEAAGGRLFVPAIVREKLEQIHRSTPVEAAGWNLVDPS